MHFWQIVLVLVMPCLVMPCLVMVMVIDMDRDMDMDMDIAIAIERKKAISHKNSHSLQNAYTFLITRIIVIRDCLYTSHFILIYH